MSTLASSAPPDRIRPDGEVKAGGATVWVGKGQRPVDYVPPATRPDVAEAKGMLKALERKQAEERDVAFSRYVQLLESGTPSDVDELHALIAKLGKSLSDLAADMKIFLSFNHQVRLVEEWNKIAPQAHEAARKAKDFREETEAFVLQRRPQQELLDKQVAAYEQPYDQSRAASAARTRAYEIRQQHCELLGTKQLPDVE